MSDTPYFQKFVELCQKRGIIISIPESRYLLLREEYNTPSMKNRLSWSKEIQNCVDWLFDTGKKNITAMRLRNWMKKAIEFQKNREIANYEKSKFREDLGGSRNYEASLYAKALLAGKSFQ